MGKGNRELTPPPIYQEKGTEILPSPNDHADKQQPNLISDWPNLVSKLNLSGMTLALARHCALIKMQDDIVELSLDATQKPLHTKIQEKRLLDALNQHLGKSFNLSIQVANNIVNTPAKLEQQLQIEQQQQAMQIIEKDANVQKLMQTFNATIQPESVVLLSNPQNPI